jgi:lipopolysaccharide biosynthesis regulator YciM
LSLDPIDVNIISKLSLSYSKLLDWEQAKNTAKKLLEIDPVKYRVDVENFLAEIDLKMNN